MVSTAPRPQAGRGVRLRYGERLPKPAETALTTADAAHLLQVAEMFRWSRPASAPLLLGWAAPAPICGATTIQDKFANFLVGGSGMLLWALTRPIKRERRIP